MKKIIQISVIIALAGGVASGVYARKKVKPREIDIENKTDENVIVMFGSAQRGRKGEWDRCMIPAGKTTPEKVKVPVYKEFKKVWDPRKRLFKKTKVGKRGSEAFALTWRYKDQWYTENFRAYCPSEIIYRPHCTKKVIILKDGKYKYKYGRRTKLGWPKTGTGKGTADKTYAPRGFQ